MRSFLVLLFSLLIAPASASDTRKLDWAELPDPKAALFKDPFRSLQPQQLGALRQIVRLRRQLAQSKTAHTSSEVTASIAKHIAALEAKGINADAIIAQRFTIRDRRRKAATAGNPEINGQVVELSGFTLPEARPEANSVLLLPSRVACSHAAMPPPNQLVRVLDPGKKIRRDYFVPVRIVGELRLKPSLRPVFLIDGLRMLTPTFELALHHVEVLGERQARLPSDRPVAPLSVKKHSPGSGMASRTSSNLSD